jgi:predicted tellurium resistance membrane protein TerC
MESFLTADNLAALVTLTAMEIVLGIDNIIFISILSSKLPREQQGRIRNLGISLALVMRLVLLFSIGWVMSLTEPFFSLFGHGFSGRDLILIAGGLFLMFKAVFEIHGKVQGEEHEPNVSGRKGSKARAVLVQILLIDVVFSLDSVITAVGMANEIWIMVVAMVLSVIVMLISAGSVHQFVERHPTVKILALSFLLLIGVTLMMEGMGGHVSKGYIYFAMAFSLAIEILNIRYRTNVSKKRAR